MGTLQPEVEPEPGSALQQNQPPLPAEKAPKSSSWKGIMHGLSTVLDSKDSGNSGTGARVVVPDPTTRVLPTPRDAVQADPSKKNIQWLHQGEVVPRGKPVATPSGPDPVTLQLNRTNAQHALQMLSTASNVDILVSDGVSGTVTANLRDVPFEEALDAILRLCNLVAHREGNRIFVYPAENLPLLDRQIKVFSLDFASATDVVDSINTVKGLLSPSGSVYAMQMASQNNRKTQEAVVVEDAPDYVFRVGRYIQEIDIPPRQVQIQAYILEVDLKDDLKHGVNFQEIIKIAGNTATIKTVGFADPKATQALLATIDGKNFDAVIESLKTTTDAKTLAKPKVTVLNGQQGHVQIGEKLGYRDTTTQTETAATQAVEFLDLGVVLDVVPWVTADNRIIMNVYPQVSSGRINPETELPEETTTEVQTNVMLEDGQGIVIGGLIKEKDSDIQHKIPLLGNLPYVGLLFQERDRETQRTEVIIALLPRVVPYAPCPEAKDQLETIRATTPLFHGPLRRCPRPWEPNLRDALPMRGDRL